MDIINCLPLEAKGAPSLINVEAFHIGILPPFLYPFLYAPIL